MEERKANKTKIIIGAIIIVVVSACVVLWESVGREKFLYDKVLVAKEDIAAGEEITEKMFESRDFLKGTILKDALRESDIEEYKGKLAKQYIPEGSQIVPSFVYVDDFYIGENQAIYRIPFDWIDSMSSSIRRGDYVDIYTQSGKTNLGKYRVAFVKSSTEAEVEGDNSEKEALDRTDANAPAAYIEVIATIEQYKALYNTANGLSADAPEGATKNDENAVKFLIVQVNE